MADSWETLRSECLQCRACGLAQTRRHVVFGVGAQDAKILLVGEGRASTRTSRASPLWAGPASCWMTCWRSSDLTGPVCISPILSNAARRTTAIP